MKRLTLLLAFLLLLQSCNVYNLPASVEAAVVADKKAKVITTIDQKYKFKRLENENGRLIGITKSGSSTATKLAGMPAKISGEYIRFDLSSLKIDEIRLRNESSSTLLTMAVIAGSVIVAYLTLYTIGMNALVNDVKNLPVP